jgi:hypothetical protein
MMTQRDRRNVCFLIFQEVNPEFTKKILGAKLNKTKIYNSVDWSDKTTPHQLIEGELSVPVLSIWAGTLEEYVTRSSPIEGTAAVSSSLALQQCRSLTSTTS